MPERAAGMLQEAAVVVHSRLMAWRLDGMPLAPGLSHPDEVWNHAAPVHVHLARAEGRDSAEIGLRVSWSEEHTWGARYIDWRLVEVSESVRGLSRA